MSDNNNLSDAARQRRGSIGTGFTNMFRSNSVSQGPSTFPGPISTAMSNDKGRRLSISTLGLGNSPTASFNARRSSMSTNSDSIDEHAVEEDDGSSRTAPGTPFTRRMSFGAQAMRTMRGSGTSPNASNDQGFNWSEQLRSRAESNVTAGGRPSFSFASGASTSPPRGNSVGGGSFPHHDRAKSVSEMPAPPAQAPRPRPQKPDHIQERILKGDFYMD